MPRRNCQDGLDEILARLEAIVCLRTDVQDTAKALVDQADALRKSCPILHNGKEISDFRDLDDCYGGALEVLTANGTYYWLSTSAVQSLEFRPPKRTRDLCWRSASLDLIDGTEAEVYIPAIYVCPVEAPDEAIRMGRSSDWVTLPGGVVRGMGQRMMLLGDDPVPILEIAGRIDFVRTTQTAQATA